RTNPIKRCCSQAVIGGMIQLIASQLLDDELIVWLVLVEGLDHVIAITPGVLYGEVVLKAGTVGVASHIQPVAAPPLAVMRRGEQLLDQIFVSFGRWIVDEFLDLSRRRQQTNQVQIRAADQRSFVGLRRRFQAFLRQHVADERVDGIAAPARIAYLGRGMTNRWLESPPLPIFVGKL